MHFHNSIENTWISPGDTWRKAVWVDKITLWEFVFHNQCSNYSESIAFFLYLKVFFAGISILKTYKSHWVWSWIICFLLLIRCASSTFRMHDVNSSSIIIEFTRNIMITFICILNVMIFLLETCFEQAFEIITSF